MTKTEQTPKDTAALVALKAIVKALDAPRNRFGKLEPDIAQSNDLHGLALFYKIEHGGIDIVDQAVMVARAAIEWTEA